MTTQVIVCKNIARAHARARALAHVLKIGVLRFESRMVNSLNNFKQIKIIFFWDIFIKYNTQKCLFIQNAQTSLVILCKIRILYVL